MEISLVDMLLMVSFCVMGAVCCIKVGKRDHNKD